MKRELKVWTDEKEEKPEPLVFWLAEEEDGRIAIKFDKESRGRIHGWNLAFIKPDGTLKLARDITEDFGLQLDDDQQIILSYYSAAKVKSR